MLYTDSITIDDYKNVKIKLLNDYHEYIKKNILIDHLLSITKLNIKYIKESNVSCFDKNYQFSTSGKRLIFWAKKLESDIKEFRYHGTKYLYLECLKYVK